MSTSPYLVTDSSEESSHENAQCSFQKTEKHIDNSKGKQLKKRKLESVHKYLDELSDELEASKFCKRCKEDASVSHHLDSQANKFFYSAIKSHCIESLNHDLMRWVVINKQPFSMVEEESFIKFVSNLNPYYKIPCSQIFSTNVKIYFDLAKVKIKETLKNNKNKLALSLKVWTSLTQQHFLVVTVNWVDTKWEKKTLLLDFIPLTETYTEKYIGEKILELVKDMGIKKQIIGFTSDNVVNNLSNPICLNFLQRTINSDLKYVHCIAHTINLIAEAGQKKYYNQIQKVRHFCNKINSPSVLEEMKRISAILGCPFQHPLIDVETKWTSTYSMVERLYQIRSITDSLIISRPSLKNDYLEVDDWVIIEEMIPLLNPFHTAALVLSSTSQPSHGSSRLIILGLSTHLNQYTLINTHGGAAKEMKDKLQEYWTYLSKSSIISTILDPSTKLETLYENDRKLAIILLKGIYSSYKTNNSKTITRPKDPLEIFRMLMNSSENSKESEPEIDELEVYLSLSQEPGVDPYSWWKVHAQQFPVVSSIAADHFALQASNIPCDRAFSAIKDTINLNLAVGDLEETVKVSLLLKNWFEEKIIE